MGQGGPGTDHTVYHYYLCHSDVNKNLSFLKLGIKELLSPSAIPFAKTIISNTYLKSVFGIRG